MIVKQTMKQIPTTRTMYENNFKKDLRDQLLYKSMNSVDKNNGITSHIRAASSPLCT